MDRKGYIYQKNTKSYGGQRINWLCRNHRWNKNENCKARAKTDGNLVVLWSGEHNHPVFDVLDPITNTFMPYPPGHPLYKIWKIFKHKLNQSICAVVHTVWGEGAEGCFIKSVLWVCVRENTRCVVCAFLNDYKTFGSGPAMTLEFFSIPTIPKNFSETIFVFVVNKSLIIHKVCRASSTFTKMGLLFTFQHCVSWPICKKIWILENF